MQQYFGKLKKDNILYLDDSELNHVKNVMRMKEQDEVIIVYDGKSYICSLNKDLLSANIKSIFKDGEEYNEIVAYIPLLSEEKMDFIFQHGTELGISKFIVVQYNHCKYKLHKKDYDKKINRWNKILKEASEQSYRIYKPILEKIIEPGEIESICNVNIVCSLDKKDVKNICKVLTRENCFDTISIVFGPEGGLSTNEEELLVQRKFEKVSLGDTILRTETVPIMISSIIKYLRMESDLNDKFI